MDNTVYKGFINDWAGRTLLPITRGELVLDSNGIIALQSDQFLAKDGHPGLVTSAERALISSLTSAGGALEQVADIYAKLSYLNVLTFNGTTVNFYNTTTSAQTPIKIISDGSIGIAVETLTNEVTFSLPVLQQNGTKIEATIVRNVTVDKYGRITAISGSNLTNSDIPEIISGKTLQNCTTAGDPTGDASIVNKGYVDNKFNNISAISTGALKFGGPLSTNATAMAALNDPNKLNHYYKVTGSFKIDKEYLNDQLGVVGDELTVKAGDTLIIYGEPTAKFVYIPSADEITTVAVTTDTATSPEFPSYAGNVVLKFNNIFNVAKQGTNTAYVTLPAASKDTGGYLTQNDWVKFNSYATQLATTYVGEFASGAGVYKIGTLTIGGVDSVIYGKYSASTISLENGAGDIEYNPILKFQTTGQDDIDITIKGVNGIITKKTGNTLEIGAANEIIEQEVPQATARKVKYLTLTDGYKFGVQIGSANADGSIAQDGLTDFSQFNVLVNKVKFTTVFEAITYSLSGAANVNEYRYGNEKLKAAINVTI